jgi:hypothetical protein
MSQAEVYVVEPSGDVVFRSGFKNAFAGAFFIWQKLCDKYGFYQASPLDARDGITGFHAGKAMLDGFQQLFSHMPEMSAADYLIMESTCDGAIVPKDLMPKLAVALRSFAEVYPGGNQSLLADLIDTLCTEDIRGIAFRQTSIAQNSWDLVDNPDNEDSEERPLNIDRDKLTSTGVEHWFIEELEEHDGT